MRVDSTLRFLAFIRPQTFGDPKTASQPALAGSDRDEQASVWEKWCPGRNWEENLDRQVQTSTCSGQRVGPEAVQVSARAPFLFWRDFLPVHLKWILNPPKFLLIYFLILSYVALFLALCLTLAHSVCVCDLFILWMLSENPSPWVLDSADRQVWGGEACVVNKRRGTSLDMTGFALQ